MQKTSVFTEKHVKNVDFGKIRYYRAITNAFVAHSESPGKAFREDLNATRGQNPKSNKKSTFFEKFTFLGTIIDHIFLL